MIFATVGTQLPFPRLVSALDDLAGKLSLSVFAQTADASAQPRHIEWRPFLEPAEHAQKISQCNVVVAHAGIGTILAAKRAEKPIIVFPRSARLGEHRNEHQLATARFLERTRGVYVARDAEQLASLLQNDDLEPACPAPGPQSDQLIELLASELARLGGPR